MDRLENLRIRDDGSSLGNDLDKIQRARAETLIATIHRLEAEHALHLEHTGNFISKVLVNENGRLQLEKDGIEVKLLPSAPESHVAYKYQVNHRSIYDADGNRRTDSLNGVLNATQLQQAFEPTLSRMAREEQEHMACERAEASRATGPSCSEQNWGARITSAPSGSFIG